MNTGEKRTGKFTVIMRDGKIEKLVNGKNADVKVIGSNNVIQQVGGKGDGNFHEIGFETRADKEYPIWYTGGEYEPEGICQQPGRSALVGSLRADGIDCGRS